MYVHVVHVQPQQVNDDDPSASIGVTQTERRFTELNIGSGKWTMRASRPNCRR